RPAKRHIPTRVGVPGVFSDGPGLYFGVGLGVGLLAGFGWGWHHWGFDWHHGGPLHDHMPFVAHGPPSPITATSRIPGVRSTVAPIACRRRTLKSPIV